MTLFDPDPHIHAAMVPGGDVVEHIQGGVQPRPHKHPLPETPAFNILPTLKLHDGTTITRNMWSRAWRLPGQAWRVERSGRHVLRQVSRYLSFLDKRGTLPFYTETLSDSGEPFFRTRSEIEKHGWDIRSFIQVDHELAIWIYCDQTIAEHRKRIAELCAKVQTPQGPLVVGKDIELWLPDTALAP